MKFKFKTKTKFKTRNILKAFLVFILMLAIVIPVKSLAEEIDSTNYSILDFSFTTTNADQQNSANFGAQILGDEFLNDERFSSASYQIRVGGNSGWKSSVPLLKCFETTTSGSSNCNDLDLTQGMINICGQGGCFDTARFEIDAQNNPSDTLYSARITTDVTWASWNYIDGATFLIESPLTHSLNDYLTEVEWESTVSNLNIYGLNPNTTYYLRITALSGDFTESDPSPAQSATTALPQITFDLDIANTSGISTETSSPYQLSLGTLIYGQVTTSTNLIWFDVGTNLNEGVRVFGRSLNGGLFSSSTSYTLASSNANLSTISGYGFQEYSSTQNVLGPLVPESNFANGGDLVGGLTSAIYGEPIFNSSGLPIYLGRGSILIKARPAEDTPAAGDYTDSIILTVAGNI